MKADEWTTSTDTEWCHSGNCCVEVMWRTSSDSASSCVEVGFVKVVRRDDEEDASDEN